MKILWGPFNHDIIDAYLLQDLDPEECTNFGPHGADLIVPNDCQDLSYLEGIEFDCVLLIEPLKRLVAPIFFQLNCPVFVCCEAAKGLEYITNWIDGLIPVMKTGTEFKALEKPVAKNSLLPIIQSDIRAPLSVQFPIVCLGSGVNSLLFETLESICPEVHYLQGLWAEEIKKILPHTYYVLIPDEQPSQNHFDALRAGSILIIPDKPDLIQALALDENDYRTYNPLAPHTALNQLFPYSDRRCKKPYRLISLETILKDLLAQLDLKQIPPKKMLPINWQDYALNVIVESRSRRTRQNKLRLSLNQALTLQIETLIKGSPKELWPDLESYFQKQSKHFQTSDIQALLSVFPWHVGIRAGLAECLFHNTDLNQIEKTDYLQKTLSLLTRSPAWSGHKPELINTLMLSYKNSNALDPDIKPLVMLEGPVYSYTSFARVNLPLLKAWESSEKFDLILAHSGRRSLQPEFPDLDFKGQFRLPKIVITHHFPHREQTIDFGKRIGIMPWEYGIAPKHTVQLITEELDETWVPSQFNFDVYVRCGIDPKRLFVIPNGVDTQLYTDDGTVMELPTAKSFKFCYIGGTIPRKGFDILLKTYINTFTPEDDVCLVIKDYGGKEQYSSDSLHHQILKLAQDPSKPAIVYLYTDFMTEADLTSLFRACDVYVHPYRGEGFGMGILEAMACGLPAIIPDQGPAPEFCPQEASWQVSGLTHFMMPSPIKKEFEIQYYTDLPSFYHEPDTYFLAKAMKDAVANPTICRQKGKIARQAALKYDWKNIAELAEERICKQIASEDLPMRLKKFDSQQQTEQNDVIQNGPPDNLPKLDFDLFHPFVQPQAQGEPYGILSITNWNSPIHSNYYHWQDLLFAFHRLQLGNARARLTLVALDHSSEQVKQDIQNFCKAQKIRFASNLQLEIRKKPETLADIKTLYHKTTLFVDTDPHSSGHWHLLAQAMGIRSISSGQQPWLKYPYSEIVKHSDSLYLAWLLSKLMSTKQSIFDGLAVREHLKRMHHSQDANYYSLVMGQKQY